MADFDLNNVGLTATHNMMLRDMPLFHTLLASTAAGNNKVLPYTNVHGMALWMGVMRDKRTFIQELETHEQVKLVVNYSLRKISVYFSYKNEAYKAEIQTRDLENRQIAGDETDRVSFFTFHLNHPPEYWRQLTHPGPRRQRDSKWARVTHIPVEGGISAPTGPVPIHDDDYLKLGQWVVLRMAFAKHQRHVARAYTEVLKRGKEYRLVNHSAFPRIRNTLPPAAHLPGVVHLDVSDEKAVATKHYALQSQVTRYQVNEYQLDASFYQEYAKLQPEQAEDALRFLLARMASTRNKLQGTLLQEIVASQTGLGVRKKKKSKRLISVKKVLVTPTTLRIEPPQVETANRVLRQFKHHLDRFLRVQFIDERGSQVHTSSNMNHDNEAVYNRLTRVLYEGIKIGSVHYVFLAFSSSQLREHGCWFFANTHTVTAEKIRKWMGDFSKERVVAKHAARMGQCFSSTQAITTLRRKQVKLIPDIERNGYTFSDGVGLISPELAQEVAHAHRHRQAQTSSAFQFRLGGAKGVLTVGKHLKNKIVQLRPSQIKFQSTHRMLEINRTAYASLAFLNRQIIVLLSALGVQDQMFHDLLDEMLAQINNIVEDPVQCEAVLRQHADEFGIHGSMARIVSAGFLESGDTYIKNLIRVFRISKLKEAKKKAKIHVPEATSAFGVLDETDTLEPNQVFFQFMDGKKVQGDVIVYRCPCLHPGDVRIVQAVDCPALHDLHEVIVFSQKGDRDVPSMCSGGDLDGDLYSIVWDTRLFPTTINAEPMNHTPEKPIELDRPVEVRDIQNFFLDYVRNDNLGQIANAHMAAADSAMNGACAEVCKNLAELHSVAVDFPKTGVIAYTGNMTRVARYPDFMEKRDKPSYESQKVLGQLYRKIDDHELDEYRNQLEDTTAYDNRMWVVGMEKYVYAARALKSQYDDDVKNLMRQFGVSTEAELMSGSIVKWLKQESRENFFETRHLARREVYRLCGHWRHQHFPSLRKKKARFSQEQKEQDTAKAAAWYYVTYHPVEQSSGKRMLSFPWVAQDILCKLARTNPDVAHEPLAEMLVYSYRTQTASSSATTSSEED